MALEHVAGQAEIQIPMLKGLELEKIGQIYVLLDPGRNSEKYCSVERLYRKHTRALTFDNFAAVHFLQDEVCYKARELGGEMYFVVVGSVQLIGHKTLLPERSAASRATVHRPHDLLKMRTADSGGTEPYFGELSLFEEVCPVRTEEAKALTAVETFCLKRERVDQVREFCPEFYDRLHDFCVLSAARFGINPHLFAQSSHASRGYPKIDQLCSDIRKELLSRHQQIMQKRQAAGKSKVPSINEQGNEEPDRIQFKVLKKLNMLGQKEARLIVLDKTTHSLINIEPEGKTVKGDSVAGSFQRKHDVQKKSFPISRIDSVEQFVEQGPTNLNLVISFKGDNQRPYDLEFQSTEDKAQFVDVLSRMTTSTSQKNSFLMSKSKLNTISADGVGGVMEAAFLCDAGGRLLHRLPQWDDSSFIWTKGALCGWVEGARARGAWEGEGEKEGRRTRGHT